jgi:hypothetical protein
MILCAHYGEGAVLRNLARLVAAIAAFALAGAMLPPALARDEVSAGAFLKGYDDPSPKYRNGYHPNEGLRYFADALAEVNRLLAETRNERPLYCPFKDETIRGEQLADYLKLAVKKEPALARRPDGQALLYTLQKQYPCPEWDKSGGSIETATNAAALPRVDWRPKGDDGWPWFGRFRRPIPRASAYFNAFRWANFHLTHVRKTKPLYCLQHELIFDPNELLKIGDWDRPSLLLKGLQDWFKCPKPGEPPRASPLGPLLDSAVMAHPDVHGRERSHSLLEVILDHGNKLLFDFLRVRPDVLTLYV